jgi:hypothetical protein
MNERRADLIMRAGKKYGCVFLGIPVSISLPTRIRGGLTMLDSLARAQLLLFFYRKGSKWGIVTIK